MQNIGQIDAARQVAEQEQVFCQLQERFGVLGQRPYLAIHDSPNILLRERSFGCGLLESAYLKGIERVVRLFDETVGDCTVVKNAQRAEADADGVVRIVTLHPQPLLVTFQPLGVDVEKVEVQRMTESGQ